METLKIWGYNRNVGNLGSRANRSPHICNLVNKCNRRNTSDGDIGNLGNKVIIGTSVTLVIRAATVDVGT